VKAATAKRGVPRESAETGGNIMILSQICRELIRYLLLHFRSLDYYSEKYCRVPLPDGSHDVVVSFTTIPDRIHRIAPMIKSLMDQDMRPHRIYLVVPKFSKRENKPYQIPPEIETNPHITVLRAEKDWGPATKLIPTVLHERHRPETRIIVVDDDTLYPRKLISTFTNSSEQYPDAAFTSRGWNIPAAFVHQNRINVVSSKISQMTPVEVVQGASGYLVKPRFLEAQFFDYKNAPAAAFFADDIWVSGHLASQKIPRYVMPMPVYFFRIVAFSTRRTLSLSGHENISGCNNETMYRYFKRFWKVTQ
jgi:hypothetical protein